MAAPSGGKPGSGAGPAPYDAPPYASPPVAGPGPDQGIGSQPIDDATISESLRSMRSEGDYQLDFPGLPPPAEPPTWLEPIARFLRWAFGDGSTFFMVLFWVAAAVLLALLLYNLVPAVRDVIDGVLGRSRLTTDDDDAMIQPDIAQAHNLLAEADALAAAGQFGAAVRLLLGRSLEDIAVRRPGLLQPALTARALGTHPQLPPDAQRAFGDIAAVVEYSLFAQQPVDADGWVLARAAYADFALADRWRAPPAAPPATAEQSGPIGSGVPA